MKPILLILSALLICFSAMAQTNIVVRPEGGDLSADPTVLRLRPGIRFILDANNVLVRDTNIVTLPAVQGVESWLGTIQNWLTGAAALVAALLGWWGKRGNDRANTLPILIRAIENFDSQLLKDNIKADAKDKGVDVALHDAVRENTSIGHTNPKGDPVDNPAPVVEPPKGP